MKFFTSAFLFIFYFLSCAQSIPKIWYFGDGNFLDFNTNLTTPVLTPNGTQNAVPPNTYCTEGSSVVCDNTGQLLFYNNSEFVFDKNFNQMPNGFGLIGDLSSAQTIAIPKPGSNTIYYIFHLDYCATSPNLGLFYSEVDLSLNGGLGDVTNNKNIPLNSGPCSEQLTAITHCNGQDIWIITHSLTGNTYLSFLITSTGISTAPVISNIGVGHPDAYSGMSYMCCSPDGTKVALAGRMNNNCSVELSSFDNLTGTFCSPQILTVPELFSTGSYGVTFSSDGNKLYTSAFGLHQYDLTTNSWYSYAVSEIGGALMRGPNDKIYIVSGCDYYDPVTQILEESRKIHVINNPNIAGSLSNLQLNAYNTPREVGLGLPTFYTPTNTTNNCNPILSNIDAVSNVICENDCITFNNLSEGTGIVSTTWTFQGGTPSNFTGNIPPQICYSNAGNYLAILTLQDCNGQNYNDTISITVNDCSIPSANFTSNLNSICPNECITFNDLSIGTNITSWNWTFNGGTPSTSSNQTPPVICYSSAGNYDVTLTVENDLGSNTITLQNYVTVNQCLPPKSLFQFQNEICQNTCINLIDQSLNSPTSWNWQINGSNQSSSTIQNPTNICFETEGIFDIQLITSNLYGSDTIIQQITVKETPNAGIDNATTICSTNNQFSLVLLLEPAIDQNGTFSCYPLNQAFNPPFFIPANSTANNYELSYVLVNDKGCSDTSIHQITVKNPPTEIFNTEFENCIYEKFHYTIENLDQDIQVLWSNGSNSTEINLNLSQGYIGQEIVLPFTLSNTCNTINDTLIIKLIDCDSYIYIPNSFTPDESNRNEIFIPSIEGVELAEFKFSIFNRWGELVFESTDSKEGWNGKYKEQKSPDGVYSWTLTYSGISNHKLKTEFLNGHVTLIR